MFQHLQAEVGRYTGKDYKRVEKLPIASWLFHALISDLQATSRKAHWLRPCALLYTFLIGACAGPHTRIEAPPQAVTPLPLIAAHGAAGHSEEQKVLARARCMVGKARRTMPTSLSAYAGVSPTPRS